MFLVSTDYFICNSLSFTEIIPVVFTEGNEEERLDNLFEVGEGVAPAAVLSDAESVVLSLARKCLRYHANVEWGMLLAPSYTSVQYCCIVVRISIWKAIIVGAVHQCTALVIAALKLRMYHMSYAHEPTKAYSGSMFAFTGSPLQHLLSVICLYVHVQYVYSSICCILLPFPGVLDSPKTLFPISIALEDTCRTPTPLLPPEGEEAPPIAVHGIGILKQLLDALSQDKDSGQPERRRWGSISIECKRFPLWSTARTVQLSYITSWQLKMKHLKIVQSEREWDFYTKFDVCTFLVFPWCGVQIRTYVHTYVLQTLLKWLMTWYGSLPTGCQYMHSHVLFGTSCVYCALALACVVSFLNHEPTITSVQEQYTQEVPPKRTRECMYWHILSTSSTIITQPPFLPCECSTSCLHLRMYLLR